MKVLFVCVHNSARSQMAMTYLNALGQGKFTAESAGLEPGTLNPLVVEAMAEAGYDISHNPVQSVFDLFRQGKDYDMVIKVCDQSQGQKCPTFPGARANLAWDFPDPSTFTGTHAEKLQQVRDQIKTRIEELINVYQPG